MASPVRTVPGAEERVAETFPIQAVGSASQQYWRFPFLSNYIIVSGGNILRMILCNHGNLSRKALFQKNCLLIKSPWFIIETFIFIVNEDDMPCVHELSLSAAFLPFLRTSENRCPQPCFLQMK